MRIQSTLLVVALALHACSDSSTNTQPGGNASGTEVVLAIGQDTMVNAVLTLGVSAVPADSRCPLQAMCVWAGEAAVAVHHSLGDGPSTLDTLYTTPGRDAVVFGPYRITLLELTPHPQVPGGITPGEYRARFRVETLPD